MIIGWIMSGVPILKFLFRSESPVLSEAIKLNHEIGPTIFHDEKILVNFIKEIPASLVIVSLANKNDLKQLVVFFKLAKKIHFFFLFSLLYLIYIISKIIQLCNFSFR